MVSDTCAKKNGLEKVEVKFRITAPLYPLAFPQVHYLLRLLNF